MPPIKYSTGSGSTASLPSLAAADRLEGTRSWANGSAPWTFRALSTYTRPASSMYADIASANARNAFLIRQAQRMAEIEAQRRRLEEQRRLQEIERQQRLQEQNRAVAEGAVQGTPNVPLSQTPFAGVSPEQMRAYLGPQGPQAVANLTSAPGQDTPLITRLYNRGVAAIEGETAQASDEAVKRIMAGTYESISRSKQLGYPTIYEEITMLENSFDERLAEAAVETWGQPRERTFYNPETGQMEFAGYDWSYVSEGAEGWGKPVSYLGLAPGLVPFNRPTPPAADAPYKDWVEYRNQLQQQIRKPLYTQDSVMETLWNMGEQGVKQFQKALLAGQFYDTNDSVKLGVIGSKEIAFMDELMTYGNINGLTWEQQLDVELTAARKAADSYGGGYGGGGGGGGTTVYKQIQYTQTSIAQARSLLIGILRDALGREPTDTEVSKFLSILNKAESKSPTKTVTRTTTSGDMTRAVSRTTPSAVDPEAMAREFARSIGGGEPYEANATANYLAGFLESLGRASV